jgi:DNA-binding Lrp family transcriptional regulator
MHEMRIDDLDLAILEVLQGDATITNARLSELVHLSPSQCSRRRASLEEAGIVEGYTARLSAGKLGFTFQAMVRISLLSHGKANAEDFSAYLDRFPEVSGAYSVSGDCDYILHIRTRDLEAFSDFIHKHLLTYPQMGQIRSDIVLTVLKEPRGLPLRPARPSRRP